MTFSSTRISIYYFMVFLFFTLLSSCIKQPLNECTAKEEPIKPYQSTIKECSCTTGIKDGFRIELILDGKKLCFDRLPKPDYVDKWQKRFTNVIHMGRINSDSTLGVFVEYYTPAFLNYNLPHIVSVDYCEIFGVHVTNFYPYQACHSCPEDDWSYTSSNNSTATILSYKDGVLEGSFEGIYVNSGFRKFTVTDGYFKIKIEMEEE